MSYHSTDINQLTDGLLTQLGHEQIKENLYAFVENTAFKMQQFNPDHCDTLPMTGISET